MPDPRLALFCAVLRLLGVGEDWARGLPHLSEFIAQVHGANICPQVSDAIADRLNEGTNKHCLVNWQIVTQDSRRHTV